MPFYTDDSGALVAEFGQGDILIGTAKTTADGLEQEIILMESDRPHPPGAAEPSLAGKRSDEVGTRVRLVFKSPNGVPIFIEKLTRIIDAHLGNVPRPT